MGGSAASTSSFCTMGGMSTMHQHRRMQQSNNWPVILPNHTKHEGGNDTNKEQHRDMDSGDGHQDHGDMNHHDNHNNSHSHGMSMGGTTMYMDGFHSALFPSSHEPPPPCLNLFHPSWTLHTHSKFLFAMAVVTLLGMLVEACGVWRVKCLRKGRGHRRELKMKRRRRWEEQHREDMEGQRVEFRRESRIPRGMRSAMSDISDVSDNEDAQPNVAVPNRMCPTMVRRMWRRLVPKCIRTLCAKACCCFRATNDGATLARRYDVTAAGLHATRAVLGYLLMLAVMTYAVEFLLSAVAGMVIGRYWFVDRDGGDNPAGGVMNGAVGVGGGIGGMGLGEAGRQGSGPGVGLTDLQGEGNDGTWGGGDPCCGIDDDDEDGDDQIVGNEVGDSFRSGSLHEPLLSPLMANNVGVTRRSGVGLSAEENNPS